MIGIFTHRAKHLRSGYLPSMDTESEGHVCQNEVLDLLFVIFLLSCFIIALFVGDR